MQLSIHHPDDQGCEKFLPVSFGFLRVYETQTPEVVFSLSKALTLKSFHLSKSAVTVQYFCIKKKEHFCDG